MLNLVEPGSGVEPPLVSPDQLEHAQQALEAEQHQGSQLRGAEGGEQEGQQGQQHHQQVQLRGSPASSTAQSLGRREQMAAALGFNDQIQLRQQHVV
ncbi:hypothetical protein HaLaN_20464 [Haematococcus lacustris]|uniref:Uncharacterized protein n=1 Tax=Haematococcus lacustris TaxID=44745 RepID=A0A699ZXC0_HAELA|nr:hypothetical protein HaLaN_20464 [Haematococcus lacustris]